MKCNVAIESMHDYLDGDLSREEAAGLKSHLTSCDSCFARFEQLQKTEAAVFHTFEFTKLTSDYDAEVSKRLNHRIMEQLPRKKNTQRKGIARFIYRNPGITAASLFALVMLGSFYLMWEADTKLVVAGEDLQHVIIEGNTVIVPAGAHLMGNLTVQNGAADVQGKVDGNVTVIDGTLHLASTGYIAGQSRTISQALDWFWYKVTQTFGGSFQ